MAKKAFDAEKWAALAISKDKSRPVLTAVHVRDGRVMGVDGFRIHLAPAPAEATCPFCDGPCESPDLSRVTNIPMPAIMEVSVIHLRQALLACKALWASERPGYKPVPWTSVRCNGSMILESHDVEWGDIEVTLEDEDTWVMAGKGKKGPEETFVTYRHSGPDCEMYFNGHFVLDALHGAEGIVRIGRNPDSHITRLEFDDGRAAWVMDGHKPK